MNTADLEVLHGYTLADLDRLARRVVTAHLGWWSAGDRHDQYETAWSGIAEHLCTASEVPKPSDLTAAGTAALDREVKASKRHHGATRAGGIGPRYAAYWYEPPAEPWEDRLVDWIAISQILQAVPATGLQALGALASAPDRAAAAEAVGVSERALSTRLSRARKVCREHWFAPEIAPPMKQPPSPGRMPTRDQCDAGHALTPDNIMWMAPKKPGRPRYGRCRACERERAAARLPNARGVVVP